jgi:hypothetical protein
MCRTRLTDEPTGRFDGDLYELQHGFLLGVLAPFLTEATVPW